MVEAFIRLHDGTLFDLLNPDPQAIDAANVSVGLGNVCRYGGQLPRGLFYSVAEHSWLMAMQVPERLRLHALLHDAAEGLGLGDVVSPLKAVLPGYGVIEQRVLRAVARRFCIDYDGFGAAEIVEADKRMRVTEHLAFRRGPVDSDLFPYPGVSFPLMQPAQAQRVYRQVLDEALRKHGWTGLALGTEPT